jgi:hypothetical protein
MQSIHHDRLTELELASVLLYEARLDNRVLPELPIAYRPRTLEEGYAVSDLLARKLGWPIAGWFCGATNPEIQRLLRLPEPYCARLFGQLVHSSPATLNADDFPPIPIIIETEIAFLDRLQVALDRRRTIRGWVNGTSPRDQPQCTRTHSPLRLSSATLTARRLPVPIAGVADSAANRALRRGRDRCSCTAAPATSVPAIAGPTSAMELLGGSQRRQATTSPSIDKQVRTKDSEVRSGWSPASIV